MPKIAEFQLEDGRIAQFEVPDGMSPADAERYGQAELAKMQEAYTNPLQKIAKDALSSEGGKVAVDVAKQFPAGIAKGVAGLSDMAISGLQAMNPAALPMQMLGIPKADLGLTKMAEENLPNPEGAAGRFARSIGEMVPGVATGTPGMSIPRKLAMSASMGVGGEALDSRHDNPLMRFLGTLIGGVPATAAAARYKNSDALLAEGMQGTSEAQIEKARELKALLDKLKLPYTNAQLFGPISNLPGLQMRASENPAVRAKLAEIFQKLPERVSAEMSGAALPLGTGQNRREVRNTLQEAANAALEQVRGKARADYQKAMPLPFNYDPGRVEGLYSSLLSAADGYLPNSPQSQAIRKFAETLVKGRSEQQGFEWVTGADGRKVLQQTIKSVPEFHQGSEQLNNMYKAISADVAKLPDEFKSLPLKEIRALWKKATPEFQPARDAYRARIEAEYNPMAKSLTGDIAMAGGGPKADRTTAHDAVLNMMTPKTEGQYYGLKNLAADTRGAASPEHPEYQTAFSDAVSEVLQKVTGEVTDKRVMGVEEVLRQPVELSNKLVGSGSGAKAANMQTMLEEAAKARGQNPRDVVKGFSNLMKAFQTYADAKVAPGLAAVETERVASRNIFAQILQPFGRTARTLEDLTRAEQFKKVADVLTSPEGIDTLVKLRGYSPWSGTVRNALATMVDSALAARGESQQVTEK